MPDKNQLQPVGRFRRAFRQGAKQAGLSLLFSTVLMIPRLRRLRRKVWAWTAIRLVAALAGAWLTWRFTRMPAGTGSFVLGLVLLAFALLVGAKPEAQSVDTLARSLNAMVVLNGGTFVAAGEGKPSRGVRIFVSLERLFVLDSQDQRLAEIPVAAVRHLVTRAVSAGRATGDSATPWELEIAWESGGIQKATFRYEGFFADHLARVAETTLSNLLRKDLPVLKA